MNGSLFSLTTALGWGVVVVVVVEIGLSSRILKISYKTSLDNCKKVESLFFHSFMVAFKSEWMLSQTKDSHRGS